MWIWLIFGFLLLLTIASVALLWKHRSNKNPQVCSSFYDIPVLLEDNGIYFPKGYFFRKSSIGKSRFVSPAAINEVHLSSFPASLVINHNEMIFVHPDQQEALYHYAIKHNIPVSERLDIWSTICEHFLDTELNAAKKEWNAGLLHENGILLEEAAAIRRRVGFIMAVNYYAWEWEYLGLFDYLRWGGAGRSKTYWWSMEKLYVTMYSEYAPNYFFQLIISNNGRILSNYEVYRISRKIVSCLVEPGVPGVFSLPRWYL